MQTRLFRLILLLVLIVGIALAVIYRDRFDASALASWVEGAGFAGPLLFVLIYALATVFFLPGSVLTLAGGALFGPVWGTLINLTGATLGAALAFLVARYLAADWVERKTGGPLKQLKEGVEGEGWRFVAFVRLVPLFPFNLLNYALGLTRIHFLEYVVASWLFMLPGAIAYTYVGYVGREALAGEEGLIQKILLALALLAVVGFLPRFISILRRGPMLSVPELKQKLDAGEDLLVLDAAPMILWVSRDIFPTPSTFRLKHCLRSWTGWVIDWRSPSPSSAVRTSVPSRPRRFWRATALPMSMWSRAV